MKIKIKRVKETKEEEEEVNNAVLYFREREESENRKNGPAIWRGLCA